ncbi:YcxB family protein [Geothrix sp. PMB-07]|uniref:YcxB family protein n=1 Tax=Geothrix sp. PMB-07 TaxID=3068640 RepID=UPI00274120DA|nr:YcxB family protein [Geothrix sp. PMB-07]WLT31867.1 YcxB family protein [Geothrix sp. PMB-07]
MLLTTQYTLTPDEALRGTRTFKRLRYAVSVGSGALVALLGLVVVASEGSPAFGFFMIFNGLLFVAMPELVLRWGRRRRGSAPYSPITLQLDDDGLRLETEVSEGGLPWEAFSEIRRRSGFWIFRMDHTQAVLVPERAFEPAANAELEAFLRGRGILAR